jgi:hypothetical protein
MVSGIIIFVITIIDQLANIFSESNYTLQEQKHIKLGIIDKPPRISPL